MRSASCTRVEAPSGPVASSRIWEPLQLHLLDHDGARSFVAQESGRVVGFTAGWVREGVWFLSALFVLPEWQGRGIGRRLLNLAWGDGYRRRITVTAALQPVSTATYARHGLIPTTPILRFEGEPLATAPPHIDPASPDPDSLRLLDQAAYGFDRSVDHSVEEGGDADSPAARRCVQALVDPAITTRFWFTKRSGKLVRGATVRWEWEMYGAWAKVWVKEIEDNSRILIDWGDDDETTTVEFRFVPQGDDATYVRITETGHIGDGDQVAARAADSTGGFTFMVCALKALLEHDVVLTVVRDAHPQGLQF